MQVFDQQLPCWHSTVPAAPKVVDYRSDVEELMPDGMLPGGGRPPALLYLKHHVVNLDRIAEISVNRGRVTLCYAFARLDEPGARLVLTPAEAEPLLAALQAPRTDWPAWVPVADRLVNLDLVLDVGIAPDQLTLISALPDQRGGPLPRRFPRTAMRPLLAYFEQIGVLVGSSVAPPEAGLHWVVAGTHLVNLALVSAIRFGPQEVQLGFAGLPQFARVFSYAEATQLIERLQQLGSLPIDAVPVEDPGAADEPQDVETGAGILLGPANGRRRGSGS